MMKWPLPDAVEAIFVGGTELRGRFAFAREPFRSAASSQQDALSAAGAAPGKVAEEGENVLLEEADALKSRKFTIRPAFAALHPCLRALRGLDGLRLGTYTKGKSQRIAGFAVLSKKN
jgi:hypothetical protein